MNKQSKEISRIKFLLGLVILLLGIFAILFWPAPTPKPSVPIKEHPILQKEDKIETKEIAAPEKQEPAKVTLRSSLPGRWYPANAETLNKQIAGFFQKAESKSIDDVIALILPHAGYQFSGQTAASGLKTTNKKYKRVVIIGPTHYVHMEEMLSVPRVTHYETPLGQIPLDVEFIDKLLEYSVFQNMQQAHKYEHSVQIEIPLLQHSQGDFELVPIVAGTCSLEAINKAGTILRSLVDDQTLVIASSDFVHYGPNYGYMPFRKNIPEQIEELDMGAYEYIGNLDSKGFLEYKRRTGATICGYVPIAILLSMLDKPVKAELIKYTTSGELTGDFTNSVSYLSAAFSGSWPEKAKAKKERQSTVLSKSDKKELLKLARRSLVYYLEKGRVPQPSELDVTISDRVKSPRAAFVTLTSVPKRYKVRLGAPETPRLRGCIGDIFPRQPLYKSVITNAINAGVNDRRFPPVTKAECNDIAIEISALTAPEPVASPDDIRIGIDGVVLNKDGRSAVYLPQVAPGQGWDVNQMLTQLSLKAGLPADAWKEGASFLVFQAVVFGEER